MCIYIYKFLYRSIFIIIISLNAEKILVSNYKVDRYLFIVLVTEYLLYIPMHY